MTKKEDSLTIHEIIFVNIVIGLCTQRFAVRLQFCVIADNYAFILLTNLMINFHNNQVFKCFFFE